ncbi:tetratricopeptide repeat protein [Pedobacter sp. ASV1-7]|uniref:type IX secretion system periplasmic lipoprotein PorW/SprE n=1 Tax=Pedobacter sp. ASV1-7 TaxID=3145237 RepID=UPI0032E88A61
MKNYAIRNLKVILFTLSACIIYSCGTQKDNASSRSIQNLTARYNYIYNSNVIITTHQQELVENHRENYDQILPVYLGPEIDSSFIVKDVSGGKGIDDVIKKAKVIILEKTYSNYLDEAYILLGKAQFYKGNYFNAAEYFSYTTKNYSQNTKSYIEALNWKARSLMQIRRLSEAGKLLDTLSYAIAGLKKNTSEPLATLAQMAIYQHKYPEAISFLKDAIKASNNKPNKIRWTYILAQLSEQQKNFENALLYYRKVEKSNAPFEMYFNANLNRIKINALSVGKRLNRQEELLRLLKDDKNTDYNDQVYYQIAESLTADSDFEKAKKYYNLSIQKSEKNQYQKGLSYLKMADLNFKHIHNYLNAKLYYDSAVNTLPKSYPGYDIILKKSQNLEYLTKRYQIISKEDTLQVIARLPERDRKAKIEAIFNPVVEVAATAQDNTTSNPFGLETTTRNKSQSPSTFYFNNSGAVSSGYSNFKRKWGNRKLDDNWRQSIRSSAQATTQDITRNMNDGVIAQDNQAIQAEPDKTAFIKEYTDAVPTTPELITKSNQKIIDAYYDIASFYLQKLNDPEEAEEVYQILLNRFPNNNHLAASYYSLFLITKNKDVALSNNYKNKVLKEYPNSVYAKTILDPSFSLKQTELETVINKQYNETFEHYQKRDFPGVIQKAGEVLQTNKDNYLSPQFAYLKAIAIGRTNNVDSLMTAFEGITTSYQDDRIITPLVREHIAYINTHIAEFKSRNIALPDSDPGEPLFQAKQPIAAPAKTQQPDVNKQPIKKTEAIVSTPPVIPVVEKKPEPIVPPPAPKVQRIFSTETSTTYYYVIDVADASLTLSSSRFGIGQFNRGNYSEAGLKHQLKEFDNDQLIYVGNFSNFDDAKTYAEGITPLLGRIMKVPANIYKGFIISKENFDKLTSKDLLNKYLEFYKNNY